MMGLAYPIVDKIPAQTLSNRYVSDTHLGDEQALLLWELHSKIPE